MKTLLILILSIASGFSQNLALDSLVIQGQRAFQNSKFDIAKEKFLNVLKIDSVNKIALYNLAACELSQGNNDMACEYLYQSYLANDADAANLIKQYCPSLRNGTIMLMDSVEEPVKFIYKGEEFPLYENKDLHPKYKKALLSEIRKSSIVSDKIRGRMYMQIHVNKDGIFDGKIIRINVDEKDKEIVRMEVIRIFRDIVIYVPAKYKGKSIEVLEPFSLPMDFN